MNFEQFTAAVHAQLKATPPLAPVKCPICSQLGVKVYYDGGTSECENKHKFWQCHQCKRVRTGFGEGGIPFTCGKCAARVVAEPVPKHWVLSDCPSSPS